MFLLLPKDLTIIFYYRAIVKEAEFKILGNTNTLTKRTEKEQGLPIQNVVELYNLIAKSNVGDKIGTRHSITTN